MSRCVCITRYVYSAYRVNSSRQMMSTCPVGRITRAMGVAATHRVSLLKVPPAITLNERKHIGADDSHNAPQGYSHLRLNGRWETDAFPATPTLDPDMVYGVPTSEYLQATTLGAAEHNGCEWDSRGTALIIAYGAGYQCTVALVSSHPIPKLSNPPPNSSPPRASLQGSQCCKGLHRW